MKKSVLLGIAALALMALPAFAGEEKWEGGWPGHWVWDSQFVTKLNVKMVIPLYVEIVEQRDIWLEQVDCAEIGKNPARDKDWPCFKGCRTSPVRCNFNCTLSCNVVNKAIGGSWGCSVTPDNIDAPGGNTTICVMLWKADLVGKPANSEQKVAEVEIWVKPR